MFKCISYLTLYFLINSSAFGQILLEDYKVYAAVVKTEISDSTKSIVILESGIESEEIAQNAYSTAENLTSNDITKKYLTYFWTENYEKKRPSIIDSNIAKLLIDYIKSKEDNFTIANEFNQTYKTILIKTAPIRRGTIQQDWKAFYKKYPGSGGIFSFSKTKYYTEDNKIAIVYYWVRRNGLNGHGTLAVLEKANSEWQIKYKIYLWWN